MNILVRSAVLTAYFDVARELNFNPTSALRRAGLSRAMLRDPEQKIPANAAMDLLEESAVLSGCSAYGLRMAELRQLSDFGAVSLLISHQRTLRDALATTIRYRRLLNQSLAMEIEDAGTMVILRQELMSDRPQRQATELAIGVLHRMCARLLGDGWRPQGVRFMHPGAKDLAVHRRVFACRISFDADFNGIVCARADLDAPNPTADAALARYAQRFVETLPDAGARSLAQDVRHAIYLSLPAGRATLAQIAPALGLSARTMQRQLAQAGVDYSDLLNEVRREMVQRYMEDMNHSVGRIAEMLGYSHPSAFTRWFGAQFGTSPQTWRLTHTNRRTG